jgi:hypothetical protein
MFQFIGTVDDEVDEPEIFRLGLGGMASEAIKLCQPEWHGFAEAATLTEMYELSVFVGQVEQHGDDALSAEDEGIPKEPGLPIRLLAYLSDYRDWTRLPAPYAQLRAQGDRIGYFDPVVIMLLSAQALTQIDQAAVLIARGSPGDAIKHIVRAADSLSHASGLAGYQESERSARRADKDRRSTQASLGGQGRSDRYRPAREWVINSFRSKVWKSPLQAAKALAPGALEVSKNYACGLSEDRIETTVYDWIRKDVKTNPP